MANKKLLWLLIALVTTGFFVVAFMFSKKILPPVAASLDIPANTEPTTVPLALASGATLIVPTEWIVQVFESEDQYQTYEITTPLNEIPLTDIRVDTWLKGPRADEGYVIQNEKRPQALAVLENIYNHGQISIEDKKSFDAIAGEFLGYNEQYRSALTYIANTENTFRGISFYNLIGQDIGVSPVYYVVLYNPESKSILYANYYLEQSTLEVTRVNAKLRAIDWTKNNNQTLAATLDKEAREEFKNIVEHTPRTALSFGAALDELDAFMKTITRK